jgi:hypothetical protein
MTLIEAVELVNDPVECIKRNRGYVSISREDLEEIVESTNIAVYCNPRVLDEKTFFLSLVDTIIKKQLTE